MARQNTSRVCKGIRARIKIMENLELGLDPVFSVSEFNEMVNQHLNLLGEVTVEGEISELKLSQNKWIYATIKDESASLNVFGTIFQIKNFRSLEVGMKVKVRGRASLYQKTARFSLNAYYIKPSGEGALKVAYEKLKRELEKEGLFDPNRKRPLPQFPETIGLITAKGSQAYNDFIKVTGARMGGLKIYFYPAQMQGEGSIEAVIKALNFFNETKKVDVIVITRGGGSLEDLATFNDERVTRAVFASQIPTVCAIGHEGDVSLAELAADLRASTPSNAAELTVRDQKVVLKEIDWWQNRLKMVLLNKVEKFERKIELAVQMMKLNLESYWGEIEKTLLKFESFGQEIKKRVNFYELKVEALKEKLKILNPKMVLKRGFSLIQTKKGKLLKSVSQVQLGTKIIALMQDGQLETKVLKKELNHA